MAGRMKTKVIVVGVLWLLSGVSYIILVQLFHGPPSIVLINNSGSALTLFGPDNAVEISDGGSGEFNYPAQSQIFQIQTLDKALWRYRWIPYHDPKFRIGGHVYMQVEEDLRIFLLSAEARVPQQLFP